MAEITIAVSDAQVKVLRKMDANLSVKAVVQTHVDTWLAPHVAQAQEADAKDIARAYDRASVDVQQRIKTELGLG